MNANKTDTARGGDTSQAALSAADTAGADDFAMSSAPTTREPQGRAGARAEQADAGADDAGEGNDGKVPSHRLREEASKRREAETQLQQMQQQMQNMQNQLLLQQQLAQVASRQPQQQPQQQRSNDEELIRLFGDPDEGAGEAYSAVKTVAERVSEAAIEKAYQRLQGEMDKKLGGVTASLQTSERLANMKARGLIDDNAEKTIGQRMSQRIQQDARWGEAQNQSHLVNQIYMEMLENGEIRPARRRTPSNTGGVDATPWQPGSPGSPSAAQQQEALDNQLVEIQQRFPRRFGNKTIEEMRTLANSLGFTAPGSVPAPQQQYQQPQPQQQHIDGLPGMPRTFVHTR